MAEPGTRFLLGLLLSLLNCLLSSVGFTLQRKAQLLGEESDGRRRLWALGVALYVLAAVPDVLAYALVPQVVCTTVACLRLVVVVALAHAYLQEHVRGREALGTAACSVGSFLCLCYGPRPQELGAGAPAEEFYHPRVWAYLGVGLALLLALLALEHADCAVGGWCGLRYVILPMATGLAFALEKVFNTEIGFVQWPDGLAAALRAPLWTCMVLSIVLLGLTDLYLNLRVAARMPVQVFLPLSFALATSLQLFQSVAIFGEFAAMLPSHRALSLSGAVLSLVGALLIQPPRFGLLGREQLRTDDLERAIVDDAASKVHALPVSGGVVVE